MKTDRVLPFAVLSGSGPPELGEPVLALGNRAEVVPPDGRLLGCTSVENGISTTIRLWDLESGQEIRELDGHQRPGWLGRVTTTISAVVFSSTGLLASCANDRTVRLWDAAGTETDRLKVCRTSPRA